MLQIHNLIKYVNIYKNSQKNVIDYSTLNTWKAVTNNINFLHAQNNTTYGLQLVLLIFFKKTITQKKIFENAQLK